MPIGKKLQVVEKLTLVDGVTVDLLPLLKGPDDMPETAYKASGVTLVNVKLTGFHVRVPGSDVPVPVTASLFISRGPLPGDEMDYCDKLASLAKSKAETKADTIAREQARHVRAAAQQATDTSLSTLTKFSDVIPAFNQLAGIFGKLNNDK